MREGGIEGELMVSGYDQLVFMRQFPNPVVELNHLVLLATLGEISCVDEDVSIGDVEFNVMDQGMGVSLEGEVRVNMCRIEGTLEPTMTTTRALFAGIFVELGGLVVTLMTLCVLDTSFHASVGFPVNECTSTLIRRPGTTMHFVQLQSTAISHTIRDRIRTSEICLLRE